MAFLPFELLTHHSGRAQTETGGGLEWAGPYGIAVNTYDPGIIGAAIWDPAGEKLAARHQQQQQRDEMLSEHAGSGVVGSVSLGDNVAASCRKLTARLR
ncbi:hypothetical protein [Microbacterium sp. gxy059]|uniref:hypothetical protein n=1 Tax=Microbacterium sp. gxy059 TaxID=2957199 RepID=UPI003D9911F4